MLLRAQPQLNAPARPTYWRRVKVDLLIWFAADSHVRAKCLRGHVAIVSSTSIHFKYKIIFPIDGEVVVDRLAVQRLRALYIHIHTRSWIP